MKYYFADRPENKKFLEALEKLERTIDTYFPDFGKTTEMRWQATLNGLECGDSEDYPEGEIDGETDVCDDGKENEPMAIMEEKEIEEDSALESVADGMELAHDNTAERPENKEFLEVLEKLERNVDTVVQNYNNTMERRWQARLNRLECEESQDYSEGENDGETDVFDEGKENESTALTEETEIEDDSALESVADGTEFVQNGGGLDVVREAMGLDQVGCAMADGMQQEESNEDAGRLGLRSETVDRNVGVLGTVVKFPRKEDIVIDIWKGVSDKRSRYGLGTGTIT